MRCAAGNTACAEHAANTICPWLAPTLCCTSFFHTAFGAEGAQRWTTESNALQHAVSAASGSSPAVAEQQSCSALMACCHAATVLPDMPTSAQHALLFTALHQTGKMV